MNLLILLLLGSLFKVHHLFLTLLLTRLIKCFLHVMGWEKSSMFTKQGWVAFLFLFFKWLSLPWWYDYAWPLWRGWTYSTPSCDREGEILLPFPLHGMLFFWASSLIPHVDWISIPCFACGWLKFSRIFLEKSISYCVFQTHIFPWNWPFL